MDVLVTIHSLLRWLVLLDAIVTIGASIALWFRLLSLGAGVVQQLSRGFTIVLDIEVALGILLWLWRLLNGETGDPFFLVAHPLLMILAVGIAHMTVLRANRVVSEAIRGQALTLGFVASLLLILVGIPGLFLGR